MSGDDGENKDYTGTRRSKRVTASEVAKAAGVSRPAVSRAFTPGAYLDNAKRELILETAMQLGYRPNALAASLHGTSTNLVGVVAGDLNNHYDSEFIARLVAQLNAANKWPIVLGGGDRSVSKHAILSLLNYPLDALIIRGGSIPSSLISDCEKLSIPLLFSGHVVNAPYTDCICCRNGVGTSMAVELLVGRGRTAFGFIGGPKTRTSSNERLSGLSDRLAEFGLELQGVEHSDYTYEGGREALTRMIDQQPLDAIICANDAMALGALSAAQSELELRVPEDLSIIGFDDILMASWPDFNLTTIRNPLETTVSEILRLLEERLDNPEKPGEICMLDPILLERGTH
ncbi:DNA-binding transcriptional regulator, LacI/PurR family [Cohaesibacter sp. ES.047]|uniref:LacI family DNA-binding transcriptional regulator n=1 Tax=Cohaesibacter sp. ES.047 TaxID=1798205 RepID=UPI000BB7EA7D|nr:LacI family DNA-binding transcriptional regulator [Cohaesibacter sp. ES.047]SNY90033.1 DNA-binding transcriptional regulator, LacI/PurR family [Cohaesibacter sp. ES.047]